MKRLFQFISIILSSLLFSEVKSQSTQIAPIDSLLIKALNTDELLPKLIDSAIKYSPEVNRIKSSIDLANENLKISKKNILSAISLGSSYTYGNSSSSLTNGSNIISTSSSTTQTGYYNMGVGVQLPLSLLLSRKNNANANKIQVKMAEWEKGNTTLYVKQEVIRLYQDFKLSQRLVTISSKNKEASQINYVMAEKDFVQGQIPVSEISRLLDIANKSSEEFETNLNRFQTNYMQLEAYTNTNLLTLIKQVQ